MRKLFTHLLALLLMCTVLPAQAWTVYFKAQSTDTNQDLYAHLWIGNGTGGSPVNGVWKSWSEKQGTPTGVSTDDGYEIYQWTGSGNAPTAGIFFRKQGDNYNQLDGGVYDTNVVKTDGANPGNGKHFIEEGRVHDASGNVFDFSGDPEPVEYYTLYFDISDTDWGSCNVYYFTLDNNQWKINGSVQQGNLDLYTKTTEGYYIWTPGAVTSHGAIIVRKDNSWTVQTVDIPASAFDNNSVIKVLTDKENDKNKYKTSVYGEVTDNGYLYRLSSATWGWGDNWDGTSPNLEPQENGTYTWTYKPTSDINETFGIRTYKKSDKSNSWLTSSANLAANASPYNASASCATNQSIKNVLLKSGVKYVFTFTPNSSDPLKGTLRVAPAGPVINTYTVKFSRIDNNWANGANADVLVGTEWVKMERVTTATTSDPRGVFEYKGSSQPTKVRFYPYNNSAWTSAEGSVEYTFTNGATYAYYTGTPTAEDYLIYVNANALSWDQCHMHTFNDNGNTWDPVPAQQQIDADKDENGNYIRTPEGYFQFTLSGIKHVGGFTFYSTNYNGGNNEVTQNINTGRLRDEYVYTLTPVSGNRAAFATAPYNTAYNITFNFLNNNWSTIKCRVVMSDDQVQILTAEKNGAGATATATFHVPACPHFPVSVQFFSGEVADDDLETTTDRNLASSVKTYRNGEVYTHQYILRDYYVYANFWDEDASTWEYKLNGSTPMKMEYDEENNRYFIYAPRPGKFVITTSTVGGNGAFQALYCWVPKNANNTAPDYTGTTRPANTNISMGLGNRNYVNFEIRAAGTIYFQPSNSEAKAGRVWRSANEVLQEGRSFKLHGQLTDGTWKNHYLYSATNNGKGPEFVGTFQVGVSEWLFGLQTMDENGNCENDWITNGSGELKPGGSLTLNSTGDSHAKEFKVGAYYKFTYNEITKVISAEYLYEGEKVYPEHIYLRGPAVAPANSYSDGQWNKACTVEMDPVEGRPGVYRYVLDPPYYYDFKNSNDKSEKYHLMISKYSVDDAGNDIFFNSVGGGEGDNSYHPVGDGVLHMDGTPMRLEKVSYVGQNFVISQSCNFYVSFEDESNIYAWIEPIGNLSDLDYVFYFVDKEACNWWGSPGNRGAEFYINGTDGSETNISTLDIVTENAWYGNNGEKGRIYYVQGKLPESMVSEDGTPKSGIWVRLYDTSNKSGKYIERPFVNTATYYNGVNTTYPATFTAGSVSIDGEAILHVVDLATPFVATTVHPGASTEHPVVYNRANQYTVNVNLSEDGTAAKSVASTSDNTWSVEYTANFNQGNGLNTPISGFAKEGQFIGLNPAGADDDDRLQVTARYSSPGMAYSRTATKYIKDVDVPNDNDLPEFQLKTQEEANDDDEAMTTAHWFVGSYFGGIDAYQRPNTHDVLDVALCKHFKSETATLLEQYAMYIGFEVDVVERNEDEILSAGHIHDANYYAFMGAPKTWAWSDVSGGQHSHFVEGHQAGMDPETWHRDAVGGNLQIHIHHVACKERTEPTFPDRTIELTYHLMTPVATDFKYVSGSSSVRARADEQKYSGTVEAVSNSQIRRSISFNSNTDIPTGLDNVSVADENAPVEYYNLQGVKMPSENLTPGIYIRRQGQKASKVVIR